MPRRIILLPFACLLLGILTTIAVAWACACIDITDTAGEESAQGINPTREPWPVGSSLNFPDGIKATIIKTPAHVIAIADCWGPSQVTIAGNRIVHDLKESALPPSQLIPACIRRATLPWFYDAPWPRGGDRDWREIDASGWPLIAMASEYRRAPNFTYEHRFGIALTGMPRRRDPYWIRNKATTLPLLPLWPNFALDTLLFAAIWLPLLLLPGALRRALRRRHNRCPNCNYDLRATPPAQPCPECGHKRTAGPR